MREFMTQLLSKDKCKNLNVLPMKMKEEFSELIGNLYNKTEWVISIKHSGPSEPKLHYRLFCSYCQYVLVPKLVANYSEHLGGGGGGEQTLIALLRSGMNSRYWPSMLIMWGASFLGKKQF